jgi:hypothetical protein
MQERPNKLVLLTAISRFLVEEARPALADPRLSFRALIAAHLASVVASELTSDEDTVTREIARLAPFFPDAAPPQAGSLDARRAYVADLNARLAAKLREGAPAPGELAAITAALRESLREKLALENPRFDTSLTIE